MSYEVSLLRGTGIEVEDVGKIYPLKLGEIEELGIEKYQEVLYYLLFNKFSIEDEEFIKTIEKENMSDFDVIFLLCVMNKDFLEKFLFALEITFKTKASIHEDGFFYLGELVDRKVMHRENYPKIKEIVRAQNMLSKKEDKFKPKNKKAEELMKKFASMQKLIGAKEKKKEGGLTLDRIISIVASNSPTLNHLTIWDYTIYQVYEYFNEMMKRDGFEQQFQLLLQGADIKSSDLKHWAT